MRTLIVEDQGMFRDLLAKVCELQFAFRRVHAVGSGAEAEAAMKAESFDLLILDIDLPDRDGFSIAEAAADLVPPPRVLGMSAYCDEFMVHRVMHSSMHGFVDKTDQSVDSLRDAIKSVCEGKYFFTEAVRRVQRALRNNPRAFPKLLTDRECLVLTLIGGGATNDEVSNKLKITVTTAQWYRRQIMRKLDIHTSVELVLFAAEKGFTRLGTIRPPPA